jgi:hypothetical protein
VWCRGLFIGSIATGVGLVQDYVAHRFGYPWYKVLANFIIGLVLGFVAYWFNRQREGRIKQRAKELRFINHNIRNALQVLRYAYMVAEEDKREGMVKEACQRISNSLGRLTSGDYDTPLPKETSQSSAASNGH